MLRKGLFAFVMLVLCFSFVAADTIKGKITKVEDKSITVTSKQDAAGKAYTVADKVKVYKQTETDKEELKDGLKADAFAKLGKKGLSATITTGDDGKVTEILLTVAKKKAK